MHKVYDIIMFGINIFSVKNNQMRKYSIRLNLTFEIKECLDSFNHDIFSTTPNFALRLLIV